MNRLDERLSNTSIRAIYRWGEENQEDIAVEELAELIDVIMKRRRSRVTDEDVIDEIADARIVVEQLSKIYGQDRVNRKVDQKLKRLENRINGS